MATPEEHIIHYIELRDRCHQIQKNADREIAVLKETMSKIERGMMDNVFVPQGVNSMTTDSGRAHVQVKQRFYTDDRDIFTDFILEEPEERISLLELRPLQKACKLYAEEHNDVPKGIDVFAERKVIITRK